MTPEQKAKAYDEAIGKAAVLYKASEPMSGCNVILETLFPELKESEDEKVRKALIKGVESVCKDDEIFTDGFTRKQIVAWLEKQGKIDKVSYEIAEKEKNDFVSGQFIECRKSFDVFKEDNSYWFEYVGNDTYIGRSDNILNQKFHITPRQLYRLFSQQHRPKESNVNEETNAPTGYGKYVDECLNEASKHFFSEGEDKYSVADLFYAGVRCGKSWLEKQGEKKPDYCHHEVDLSNCSEEYRKAYYDGWNNCNMQYSQCKSESNDVVKCLINGMKFYYEDNEEATWGTEKFSMKVKDILAWLEKQKSADNVGPKFHEGEWVIDKQGIVHQISNVIENVTNHTYSYDIVGGGYFNDNTEGVRLWTIQDAKDGDVLACKDELILFKSYDNKNLCYYCWYNGQTNNFFPKDTHTSRPRLDIIVPATKEQRELLFKKMKEAGYEWDAEKKELKKINSYCQENCKGFQETGKCFADGECKAKREAKQKSAWSEEDEQYVKDIMHRLNKLALIIGHSLSTHSIKQVQGWLKSLKDRVQPQNTWKPTDEQMDALWFYAEQNNYAGAVLTSLYNDLKKLKEE